MNNLSSKNQAFFTRYGRLGPSSRLRFFAYQEFLKCDGQIDGDIFPFFSDDYLKNFYRTNRKSFFAFAGALFRRIRQLLRCRARNFVIEYELLPFCPFWVEKLFLRGKKYILDFDDWVWIKYKYNPFCRKKFDKLISGAAGVIAANDKIFDFCRELNSNCIKIPTTVDRRLVGDEIVPKPERFTIAWIGTPSTYRQHLLPLGDTLRRLAEKIDYTLLVISALPLPDIVGVDCRFVEWEEKSQYHHLKSAHVGIMPLADDEFSAGKSAYKLIQYQAAGLPAVASAVGENRLVLENAITGFLVYTSDQWLEALTLLHDDRQLCEKMRVHSALAGQKYFLQENLAKYRDFLTGSFKS